MIIIPSGIMRNLRYNHAYLMIVSTIVTTTTTTNLPMMSVAFEFLQNPIKYQQQRMVHLHGSTTALSTLSFRKNRILSTSSELQYQSPATTSTGTTTNDDNQQLDTTATTPTTTTTTATTTKISSSNGNKSIAGSFDIRVNDRSHTILYNNGIPPTDPMKLLSTESNFIESKSFQLLEWIDQVGKENIIALTGAGISTESGIPDYRGHNGSYHKGHKPMIHDQFMSSEYQRKRYWGRGMVGWRFFDEKEPNDGHKAIAELERNGVLGVWMSDKIEYYDDNIDTEEAELEFMFRSSGQRQLSLITQNVDALHRRAGSKNILQLHGRIDQIQCMNCGHIRNRVDFHHELEQINGAWLDEAIRISETEKDSARADGDANVGNDDTYHNIMVPSCSRCGIGFYKPRVVFFGDRVPAGRVLQCQDAIHPAHCNGLLVVGSSLAVHSAYRHVRSASQQGIPICIINVGETRAEVEQLPGVLKIEAPAGPILSTVASQLVLPK